MVSKLVCAVLFFSLPFAFQSTGIWVGSIALVLFGIIAAYTMTLLASAEKVAVSLEEQERERKGLLSAQRRRRFTYPEAAFRLFDSSVASILVTLCTILTSVGVCVAYVLFITTTLNLSFGWKVEYILVGAAIPSIFLVCLRSFRYLTFTSILGDVAVVAGMVTTVVAGIMHWDEGPSTPPAWSGDIADTITGRSLRCEVGVFIWVARLSRCSSKASLRYPFSFSCIC